MQQAFLERLRGNHLVKKLSALYKTGKFSKMFIKHPIVSRFNPLTISATCFQTTPFSLVCLGFHIRSCLEVSQSTFCMQFSFPPMFRSWQAQEFFIFCTVPLPTPELTQSHIKWVWEGAVSSWVKLLGRECDHSRPSSGEVKIQWRYAFPPAVRLHVEGQLCLYLEIQFFFWWFT